MGLDIRSAFAIPAKLSNQSQVVPAVQSFIGDSMRMEFPAGRRLKKVRKWQFPSTASFTVTIHHTANSNLQQ
jgi:hypothetical protein